MAPVIYACRHLKIPHRLVFAGQHYDYSLSGKFMKDLNVGSPDDQINIGSGTQAQQTARGMVDFERLLVREKPQAVVVEGDTNTVLSGALASVKLGIPVAHVEAGLRSHDLRMPEEHNRRLVDHMSSLLFAPTKTAKQNLTDESIWGRVFVTGNTVIDACLRNMERALKESSITQRVGTGDFVLATFHRAENVDDRSSLKGIIRGIASLDISLVLPLHPRTRKRIQQFHLEKILRRNTRIEIIPPVGYFDMLALMKRCRFIITDSGGIQEEATSPNIRKFVLVARATTDRPESVAAGFARVVGVSQRAIRANAMQLMRRLPALPTKSPYGDGKAGIRITQLLATHFERVK